MCRWGDSVPVPVVVAAPLSHTGRTRAAVRPIDRCLAPAVAWLQAIGVVTGSACCGHGRGPADIVVVGVRDPAAPDGVAYVRPRAEK